MKRGPMLVMCAATGLVVVSNLRAGAGTAPSAASVEPSGVVMLAPPTTATRPAAPRSVRRAAPKSARPRVTTTHSPSSAPTHVPSHAPSHAASRAPAPTTTRTRAPKPAPTTAPATSVVVNGRGVDTQYGVVQVQITISRHRIVKAVAIAHPHGNGQTDQINSYAVPRLDQETLQAQSARIDTVSGATYTSDGYRSSLQSALDAAHAAGVW